MDDPAEAGDQVDVERVREAAGSLHVANRVSYAPGEGDYADPVTRERVTGDLDMVGRRPAPVEVREPEVDRVEADVRDRGEERVEPGREGLEWLERCVRRVIERSPLGRSAVAQLLGDVVRAHE